MGEAVEGEEEGMCINQRERLLPYCQADKPHVCLIVPVCLLIMPSSSVCVTALK